MSFHAWYAPVGIGWNRTRDLTVDHTAAHSGYIEIISELGLIGVAGFLLWIAYAVMLGRRSGWRRTAPLLAFVAVCNVVDPVILYPATTYTWLLLLLTMVVVHAATPYATSVAPRRGPVHA
jgi:O-antigen ligase